MLNNCFFFFVLAQPFLTYTFVRNEIVSSSYSCPVLSAFVPQFLTSFYSYSYGYPVSEQIACMGSVIHLRCPLNHFIHIYSAYFGVQANTLTSCLSDLTTSSSAPTNCYNKEVFSLINSTCEYNSNCSIIVTTSQLGDPCYGYSKQLMIQYQCMDLNTMFNINQCPLNTNTNSACPILKNDSSVQTEIWCEPSLMQIQCPSPFLIQIVCAYYGIDSNYQCPSGFYYGAPTSCYSNTAKQKVITKCNGKTICQILGNPNYQVSGFSDPCNGFSKILYIQYKCVSSIMTTTTSKTATNSLQIPPFQSYIKPSGSCDTIASSPYVPMFLNETLLSFEYLITQQIGCVGSVLVLTCPVGSVIHIYSAYFGIQMNTYVQACFINSGEQPTMCYLTQSFDYINSTCEYQQICSVAADPDLLGDACAVYTQKELVVQYQCVDSNVLNTTINQCYKGSSLMAPSICPTLKPGQNEQTWCEDSVMNITCENNKKIKILCAFYGLHPSIGSSCSSMSSLAHIPVCYFQSSFSILSSICLDKSSCVMSQFATNFTDPCSGQPKGLFVQWECV